MKAAAAILAGALGAGQAQADGDERAVPDFKLTLGHYASSDHNPARDANLRGSLGPHTAWLGVYQDRSGLRQWRGGYEYRSEGEWNAGWLRPVLSLQSASGGAWVGSVTAEIGGASYAIVGFGRTNLRNYLNLNYDPNDAITLGIGSRAIERTELSLFTVHDDRLHTGQQVTHLVARRRFDDEQRLTVDLYCKRGLTADGDFVTGWSWMLGFDRGPWFIRFSHDPHAGFALPTQNRLSLGTRF